ncbi:DICT sensory domain-containing protein [Nocardioides daeguensis]|uniref:HTH merR-type domain-containing protein n=1 Tax=Nocardioides daeguensis TaxID=908359 RepID=A0ABP6VC52_9ACTN|nr:DICT sensory domain-containing protein [Nocardioides daeguensis]MBV6726244.1 MerR family transcriptional regulator [Nocardioides daeguensis]MCR1772087.1 MerR family transcriptional regulator [Nocardioides daeguensis]
MSMDQDLGAAQPPARAGTGESGRGGELTIGDLARRAGVSTAVLRMWESRYGFPEARRLASGHRRYTDADVELVRHVLRRKAAGTRLEVAIAEAAASTPPASPSIFAELRRRHPALAVHRLRKSTLIALSWAIEDECCAVADHPVLFGAFQRGRFYEASAGRWTELARVARSAVVFADEWDPGAHATRGPLRVDLAADAPMRREWAVVCDAPDSTACLSAWEIPGQAGTPDRDRLFEAVWTVDPAAVRDAARVAAAVAAEAGLAEATSLLYELAEPPAAPITAPAVTALFNRVVAYVDRLV